MKTFIFVYAVLFFQPLAFGKEAPASKLVTIDVRSDSEFAESHLEGARHMDINSAGFREQIGRAHV